MKKSFIVWFLFLYLLHSFLLSMIKQHEDSGQGTETNRQTSVVCHSACLSTSFLFPVPLFSRYFIMVTKLLTRPAARTSSLFFSSFFLFFFFYSALNFWRTTIPDRGWCLIVMRPRRELLHCRINGELCPFLLFFLHCALDACVSWWDYARLNSVRLYRCVANLLQG